MKRKKSRRAVRKAEAEELAAPLDRCQCGAVRENERDGFIYRVTLERVIVTEEPNLGLSALNVLLLPTRVSVPTGSVKLRWGFARGWACEDCGPTLRFINKWPLFLAPLVLAFAAVLGGIAALFVLLGDMADKYTMVLCAVGLSLFPAYFLANALHQWLLRRKLRPLLDWLGADGSYRSLEYARAGGKKI